jgi:hypothetical protein
VGDHEATLGVSLFTFGVDFRILYERYSVNMVVLNRLVTLSLGKFASKDKADDISTFFKDKDVKGFDRGLSQVY